MLVVLDRLEFDPLLLLAERKLSSVGVVLPDDDDEDDLLADIFFFSQTLNTQNTP